MGLEKNIENATLTILLEIDGKVNLVGMTKEHLETVELVVKRYADVAIPTSVSQKELCAFLGYK
jgi:hypothetical protein